MRRIYTIRLRGMNAAKAFRGLRVVGKTQAEPQVHAKVRELYFGPDELPRREDHEVLRLRLENPKGRN